jgi:hypothetical protein
MLNKIDHHAYVTAGQKDSLLPLLLDLFENKFGIAINGNPDFSVIHFESLGIDEARKIKEMQSMKSLGEAKRIFIISTNSITMQAQNAMLKMFEEPTENTHFFIIVPSTSFFIETLLSRMVVLNSVIPDPIGDPGSSTSKEGKILDSKKFIKSTHPERLKMIEKFLKEFKDNKEGKSAVNNFFGEIEVLLAKDVKRNKEALEKLLEIKKYIFDTSSSLKILLETLALTLPIF